MPTPLDIALEQLVQRGGILPPGARAAAAASLQRYGSSVANGMIEEVVEKFFRGVQEVAMPVQEQRSEDGGQKSVTVGATPPQVRADLTALINRFSTEEGLAEEMNLTFKLKVATDVTSGAGRFVADQTTVEAYPAWELKRVYARAIPRGEEPTNPSDEWPVRWRRAAAGLEDEDVILGILEATGRMIALKSSQIWQRLGEGFGGYDDALGNPFAPFAFNSGFDTEGVSFRDCVELGLLTKDATPQGSEFDFRQLIQLPEAA
jgi:hypothetical protein